jgi:hypothetical protein
MITLSYWGGWHGIFKEPVVPLSLEEAVGRHKTGEKYIALIGNPAKPTAYVLYALERKFCSVTFLDEYLRAFDCCMFRNLGGDRFFMRETEFRTFDGGTDKATYAQLMMLKPTGEVIVKESFYTRGTERDGTGKFDLSEFYIDPPQFGDVEPFLKFGKNGGFRPKLG